MVARSASGARHKQLKRRSDVHAIVQGTESRIAVRTHIARGIREVADCPM